MNDGDERDQPTDPAKLLPYSKRLLPEDPEAVMLPRAHVPNHPALYSENYA